MKKALRAYGAVLRLVRRLPKDTRPYYAKYARENFVNYREVDAADPNALNDLFNRTYTHSLWVLNKVTYTTTLPQSLTLSLSPWCYLCFCVDLETHLWFILVTVFGGPSGC